MFKVISEPESPLENPYISVVVTAYDRKEFILEAVKSVIDQTLERSKYEIIVVKNYLDPEIDKFLKENDVFNIYTDEKPVGAMLAYGIEKSMGEVVSFLDDDDLYLPFKLREVYEVFQENKDVVYFRNEIIKTRSVKAALVGLDENEIKTKKLMMFSRYRLNTVRDIYFLIREYGAGVNTSSTSIGRNYYFRM